ARHDSADAAAVGTGLSMIFKTPSQGPLQRRCPPIRRRMRRKSGAIMRGITSAAALAAGGGDALGGASPGGARESEPGWVRVQIEWHDEAHPLVLDVLASTAATPSRVLYMLPGGGLNFAGNFFTPRHNNLVHFMHRHGYLVVGVTPRENSLTPAT